MTTHASTHIPSASGSPGELDIVVDLMRNLSRQTDPQKAAQMYAEGLDKLNLFPADRYVAVSRRELAFPRYRITRSTTWDDDPNPWTQKERLPLLEGGLLAEILYSNEPRIIRNLSQVLRKDDPAYAYLKDMELLLASPHYDNGESINVGIILVKEAEKFPMEIFPRMVFQANLWGRATLNLVTQQKLQAAYDAIDRELRVVADIQRSLLPRELPQIRGALVAAHYQTSQHAGGDYYDFFPLPNDCWGIFVADVSGHGTPAAVLMAITHAIAHTHPGFPMPPEAVLGFLNTKLAETYTNGTGRFVTAFYGVLDPKSRTLTYASAGHPPPRLVRQCQIVGLDGETSLPLGVDASERFTQHVLQLQARDRVLIYTDGVTDTFDAFGAAFGTARLDQTCCAAGRVGDPDGFIQKVLCDLSKFAGETHVSDDRTLVVLQLE
jgi:sigma-B regulation protein RsbU (phosphoserine phosphatase)